MLVLKNSDEFRQITKVGQVFYGSRVNTTKRGNALYMYSGLLTIIIDRVDNYGRPVFKTIESTNKSKRDFSNYIYRLFTEREEAVIEHDNALINYSKNLKSGDRDKFYKKLINKDLIEISPIERNAMNWLGSLPEEEKVYVNWIRDYFTGRILK